MKRFFKWLILAVILVGCGRQNPYYEAVERELASGKRVDSLFMGISLGMKAKDFYMHCYDLNKQGLVKQGPRNESVEYEMTELPYPALMNFYPAFHDGVIYEMPVVFYYRSWAPWNKHLSADSLQLEILKLFESWYGDGFMDITDPKRGTAYVKVDGNRRISIFKQDDHIVRALFTDLLIERQLETDSTN